MHNLPYFASKEINKKRNKAQIYPAPFTHDANMRYNSGYNTSLEFPSCTRIYFILMTDWMFEPRLSIAQRHSFSYTSLAYFQSITFHMFFR